MRQINLIVVHCSDSDRAGDDTVETIRSWHLARGFTDIGYHWLIDKQARVLQGRSEEVAGEHVAGYNSHSIGICVCGKNMFTDAQFAQLARLVTYTFMKYNLDRMNVVGHHDLNKNKTCPNFNVQDKLNFFGGNYGIHEHEESI